MSWIEILFLFSINERKIRKIIRFTLSSIHCLFQKSLAAGKNFASELIFVNVPYCTINSAQGVPDMVPYVKSQVFFAL